MNNKTNTAIFVVLLGVLVGWVSTFIPKSHLEGHYLANTASIINPSNNMIHNQSAINIEFKKNDSYDLLYVSTRLCCVIKFRDRANPFRLFLSQYDKFQAYLTQ